MASRASADQISDLKAKAAALASRITALGQQEEALSEQYDAAQMRVASLQSQVQQAAQQVAAAQAAAGKARTALKDDALEAYVHGGNSPFSAGANAMATANESLLRAEYENSLAANQSDAIDQFRLAALQEQSAKSNLQQQQASVQAQMNLVNQDRQAASATAAQLQSAQNQVTGQIATLIAQQRAAAAAAAARAAAARLAAAQAAAAARARTVSDPNAAFSSNPPPPPGHGASGAVAAAETRVGDWYQWGASGPNTFDCSGLVMWAYEQVGISLPHYSGAQYADTTHIPMSDLAPGDLVFPSDPGEHVAMYIGNGEIIEAPYTGAQVHIVPMSSWFVLASRVA